MKKGDFTIKVTNLEEFKQHLSKALSLSEELKKEMEIINNFKFEVEVK